MPNRIIKESALTSRDLDQLSDGAERLFWRMTVIADDVGRFDADPRVLLAKCFPLRIDRLKPATIEKCLSELVNAGIVKLYCVEKRACGFFISWRKHQRIYGLKSKFPSPPEDCGNFPQVPANSCSYPISDIRESRIEKSVVSESETSMPPEKIEERWNAIGESRPSSKDKDKEKRAESTPFDGKTHRNGARSSYPTLTHQRTAIERITGPLNGKGTR